MKPATRYIISIFIWSVIAIVAYCLLSFDGFIVTVIHFIATIIVVSLFFKLIDCFV